KYYRLRVPANADDGVRVLARWNDAEASPAAIERIVGRGRVVLWTVPADKAWGEWATQPSYVLAMRESAKALARGDATRELTAGQPIRHALPANVTIRQATIETPGADEPAALQVTSPDSLGADASQGLSLGYADTRRAGLYRLNWQAEPGGPGSDLVAVNP